MSSSAVSVSSFVFFFNDTATTEIYTLSLHDALPICGGGRRGLLRRLGRVHRPDPDQGDRKSTRLNSSHVSESRMPSSACQKKTSRRGAPGTPRRDSPTPPGAQGGTS